jgi:hypothetical protein
MGALAIGALTGDRVQDALAALDGPPVLTAGAHALTVATQCAAMLWVGPLVAADLWAVGAAPDFLTWRGSWWAAVFPLGMFSAASAATARTWPLAALMTVSLVAFWAALALWAAVIVGLLHHIGRAARRVSLGADRAATRGAASA